MSEALERVELREVALDRPHPRQIIEQATEEANVLAEVIEGQKLYSMIQGKKFVKCEGWVTLATLRGCLPREVEVKELEGRYIAQVELVRMSDGMILTRASAECGGPEDPVWTSRPPNARRSMALTRATGKACRIAFSWVMALSGFEVTPLEEMPEGMPAQSENAAVRAAATSEAPPLGEYVFTFGKHRGTSIKSVDIDYLKWLLERYEVDIKDPSKTSYISANKSMMGTISGEIARRAKNADVAPEEIQF